MKKGIALITLVAIVIVVGVIYSMSSTPKATGFVTGGVVDNAHVITISASRFQYDPGTITVKKGEVVRIIIDNKDTPHGIVIPGLGVSGIDSVEFTADKAGTYEFKCPTMCGSGHRDMKGTLVVEE